MRPHGGEMGERVREHDWARTPLGPMERWPAVLRTTVDIVLSSRTQIILFWGPEHISVYNDAYITALGAKHPAALGRPGAEAWPEIWDTLGPLLERVRESGESFWDRDRPFLLARHGFPEQTYFDLSYDPVRLPDGTVGGVLCLVSETTGRVLGERRIRTLSRVGLAASGMTTRPDVAAAVVAALAGHGREDVPSALVYLLGDDGGLRLATPRDTAPGRIAAGDEQAAAARRAPVIAASGGRFGVPGPVIVLPLGSGTGFQGLLVCGMNPLLPVDEAHREFFQVLAESVSRALTAAEAHERERDQTRALAELDSAKTAFFANVSHELRTPLALILGPLEELLGDPSLEPARRAVLATARRNATRLLTLVNDVLTLTGAGSGRLRARYQATDLTTQTAGLTGAFRSAVESAGLTLRMEGSPLPRPVHVDRNLWERIVFNLLSNALRHTFTGGITVGVRDGGEHALVTVTDTGAGIPAEELPGLFERFYRVPGAPSRSHEGVGIGLALVRELVAMHGGRIEVTSRVGAGTTFAISLPYGSAHLPPEQVAEAATPYEMEPVDAWPPPPEPGAPFPVAPAAPVVLPDRRGPDGRDATDDPLPDDADHPLPGNADHPLPDGVDGPPPGRIVVADDNDDMRDYLVRLLRPYWTVTAVADGAAALEAARTWAPDLVVSDVMMPGMDGLELVRRLRADPATRTVPIVLLSARGSREEAFAGLAAGADEYLVKPFPARELLGRVRGILRLAEARSRHNRRLRELTEAALAINEASTAHEVLALTERYGRLLADSPGAAVKLTSGGLTVIPPDVTVANETAPDGTVADGTVMGGATAMGTVMDGTTADGTVMGGAAVTGEPALDRLAQLALARLANLERLELEHRIATTLQLALLPEVPSDGDLRIAGRYLPGSDEAGVGGDWYDVIQISGNELMLVIGDVVGKGVEAAATMGRVRNALRAYAMEDPEPGRVLARLNRMACGPGERMRSTVLCVRISRATGHVRYAGAGHPPPLVCRADGEPEYLDGALAPLIGVLPSVDFPTSEVRLERGDRLLLYTDGIVERRPTGILTGMDRLLAEAARTAGLDLEAQLESLLSLVEGMDNRDDVALLGFVHP
ncbi:SpoIIE family protein phosphatase [Streptosporangium sp. NPDC048047]|uniref:SpoIIE family protein phosphatase n=1 Tax=Streptosporangium sp. NPDC048047 TaxID=3155748 RepID=UPI003439D2F2